MIAADCRQVAIALIADHNTFGMYTFDAGGYRRGAPMCRLNISNPEIIISKHAAPHRTDQYRPLTDSKIINSFSDKFM